MTLPPVPTTTANNSGKYGVPGQYGPTCPASGQKGMSDRFPSSVSEASQYVACMAANLGASGELPSTGDDSGVVEIE